MRDAVEQLGRLLELEVGVVEVRCRVSFYSLVKGEGPLRAVRISRPPEVRQDPRGRTDKLCGL